MVRILIFFALLVSLIACSEPVPEFVAADTAIVAGFMADSTALARGQAIFEGSCASFCHTMEPEEGLDAAYLFDCQWHNGSGDKDIFDVVTNGVTGTRMIGFGSNFPEGDDDLWKVIAYIRSKQQAC